MAVNKVATAVLIDRSTAMSAFTSDGQTYFERCKWILSRIILRKIFAYENDEIGVIAFGPEGVEVVSHLTIASWDTFRCAHDLEMSSGSKAGNWGSGIVKAIDFLEEETSGKRFKYKQLVVLSNFSWSSSSVSDKMETLTTVINGTGLKLLIIGVDVKQESQGKNDVSSGLAMILEFVCQLDNGVTLSFEEVEVDMKYYSKKVKSKRLYKIQMKIGSLISLPVRWMKASADDTRLKFEIPDQKCHRKVLNEPLIRSNSSNDYSTTEKRPEACRANENILAKKPKLENGEVSSVPIKYAQDESKKTRFGASEVLLTYADLEALQRKTGPASLTFLGTVNSSKITPAMMVASDIYLIVSDTSKKSQAQFSALVSALLKQNKYGLARRVGSTNGKVSIGILYPVSDEVGKALYFLKLPVSDWVKSVPFRPLPDIVEQPLVDLMSQLIDNMSIEERGRDLLIKDPNFQLRCAQVERRVIEGKGETVPDHILQLFHPHPELMEAGEPIISKILCDYPIPSPPPEKLPLPPSNNPPVITMKKELSEEEKKEIKAIEELIGESVDNLLPEEDMMCS